jgi:hypothetical protein
MGLFTVVWIEARNEKRNRSCCCGISGEVWGEECWRGVVGIELIEVFWDWFGLSRLVELKLSSENDGDVKLYGINDKVSEEFVIDLTFENVCESIKAVICSNLISKLFALFSTLIWSITEPFSVNRSI